MSAVPAFFVHGNPTSAEDWAPFAAALRARGGEPVAVDLPGWGSTPAPPGFAGTLEAHAAWLGERMDELVPGELDLVVHDWGGIGLAAASHPARAERVRRVVVVNAVPLGAPGAEYGWHAVAKVWRTPLLGELTTRRLLPRPVLRALLGHETLADTVARAWRPETGDAILRLYRSGDPARLAAAGRDLHRLRGPALVVWGDDDPYLPARIAPRYAAALPGARLRMVRGAGHWPWLDEPGVVTEVTDFLARDAVPLDG